ncbi:MAG: stalk domain-containing protein [Bacillota bacterium]
MKKLSLGSLLLIVLILIIPGQAQAQEINASDLYIYDENGRALIMDTHAEVRYEGGYYNDGDPMIPIRFIAEHYGARVDWLGEQVVIDLEGVEYILGLNSHLVLKRIGGVEAEVELAIATYLKDDRLFVSLQFLTDVMGKEAHAYLDAIDVAILLGGRGPEVDCTNYEGICLEYETFRPGSFPEEELAIMDEEFRSKNKLTLEQGLAVLDEYLWQPVLNIAFPSNYMKYPHHSAEEVEVYKNRIEETALSSFSKEARSSQDFKAFFYLAESIYHETYTDLVDISSTETAISALACINLFPYFRFTPLIFEVELTKQEDGGWLITEISNPRGYLNRQSLKEAEPETYEQMILMNNYLYTVRGW